MEKINVLWIEDNPLQEALYVSDLVKRDSEAEKVFGKELYGFQIPSIHFVEEELRDYYKYFNLQVLQHPVEIKDFISMCLQLEDTKGNKAFIELEKVLPEIIAFDYHFSERIEINQHEAALSYNPRIKLIRNFINPNFRFVEKFKELFKHKQFLLEQGQSRNYAQSDFLRTISKLKDGDDIKKKDKDDLAEDDFGLFAAIEILRIFREHPTVAIPATFNKNETEKLSLHGKYFEWLNEYDYSVDFGRAERGNKKWDAILKDAVKALQKKIETHSKLGKITLDLFEVLKLAAGRMPQKESERVLTIRTVYGKKQLPLDGLFINVSKAERGEAIKVWIGKIIKDAFKNSSSRDELKLINDASQHAETLWSAYQDKRFWDRVNFSRLHKMTEEENYLTEDEKRKYDQYLKGEIDGFHVKITKRGKTGSYEYLNPIELKSLIKKVKTKYDHDDKLTISWTVVFVMLKIFKARMDYLKKNGIQDNTMPTENEVLTILFPLASNPIVVPVHLPHDYTAKDFVSEYFIIKNASGTPFEDLIAADETFYDEPTKLLMRWYAEGIELIDEAYFPKWIK